MRRVAKKDAEHNPIAEWLRDHGYEVNDFAGMGVVPDILVHGRGVTSWVEIKTRGSSAKWTAPQLRFIADTDMNVCVVYDREGALKALRERKFLSQRSKDGIAALLALEPRKNYTPKMVEKLFGERT
jgi:hypothetical protein